VGEDLFAAEGSAQRVITSLMAWKELTCERMSNGIELKCCSAPFLPRTRASGLALLVLVRARFFAGAEAVKGPKISAPSHTSRTVPVPQGRRTSFSRQSDLVLSRSRLDAGVGCFLGWN
jgi:hypothetical protein